MSTIRGSRWANLWDSLLFGTGRAIVLLLPATLLLIAAARCWDTRPWILLGGLIFQVLILPADLCFLAAPGINRSDLRIVTSVS